MNTLNFTVEVPENKKSNITPIEELSPVVRDLIGILPNNLPADDLNGDSVREQVLTEKYLQNQTTLLQATRNIS